MNNRLSILTLLLMLLIACSFSARVSAQFEDEPDEGFSEEDGSPSDRDRRSDRDDRGERRRERGDRGDRFDRGEGSDRFGRGERGFRGPRPNPLFEALDADGDGMITMRELRQAARNLKDLDADGDGNISLEEASPRGGFGGPGGFGDPEAMLDRWMENDANGDGQLTQDEIPEFLARMLTGADTNGDQALDRNELQQAMQNMRNNFRGPGGFGGFGGQGFGAGGGDPDTMTRQMIAQADRNGDGTISENEMNPQMARMFQGADANNDRVLDAREIRMAVETQRQRFEQFRGRQFGGENGGQDRPDPRQRRGRDDNED